METEVIKANNIQVSKIRDILTEDFSHEEINRIVVAMKTQTDLNEININNLRFILKEDFSEEFINRAIMTLKMSSS